MIGHMGSHEWRSDTHPADRIKALEARVKELEDALEWASEHLGPEATKEFETDNDCVCPVCNALHVKKEKP